MYEPQTQYKKVMHELIETHTNWDTCDNCGKDFTDTQLTTYWFCKKFISCSGYCEWEIDHDIKQAVHQKTFNIRGPYIIDYNCRKKMQK